MEELFIKNYDQDYRDFEDQDVLIDINHETNDFNRNENIPNEERIINEDDLITNDEEKEEHNNPEELDYENDLEKDGDLDNDDEDLEEADEHFHENHPRE
ncbi:hypothetical protein GKZ90_0004050 [Flavobacterium sp. MC2016-06]|jgi:hypothetical protein|uniref:hypothetical protein n=1 Tax=Flavobacterium sp. MC2016-06 TaxID=2676308 RepID=UPI0012BAD5A0|nr:hypothetical protein [Flavobacterium sp. MC2016-06]MBU3858756.1 hypothetical protein [Flavobacterium sp. MC2016-06]